MLERVKFYTRKPVLFSRTHTRILLRAASVYMHVCVRKYQNASEREWASRRAREMRCVGGNYHFSSFCVYALRLLREAGCGKMRSNIIQFWRNQIQPLCVSSLIGFIAKVIAGHDHFLITAILTFLVCCTIPSFNYLCVWEHLDRLPQALKKVACKIFITNIFFCLSLIIF